MNETQRVDARFLFGGENFARSSAAELKRAAVLDGIAVLVLLLGLAGAAFGRSQDPQKDDKQAQQPAAGQNAASTAGAADKATAKKPKKVYGEDDLKNLSGGVSVVGDAKAGSDRSAQDTIAATSAGSGKDAEKQWRARAQQIHTQIDATDGQIKNLKEDIKKNGASGFDAQSGMKQGVVYIDDKNARLQKLENKKKSLEQSLDQLQDEARKAGVDSDWVR